LGRSLRNGRTEIDVHEIDLNCLDAGGGMGCWREDRGETFDGYDNDEYKEDHEILRERVDIISPNATIIETDLYYVADGRVAVIYLKVMKLSDCVLFTKMC